MAASIDCNLRAKSHLRSGRYSYASASTANSALITADEICPTPSFRRDRNRQSKLRKGELPSGGNTFHLRTTPGDTSALDLSGASERKQGQTRKPDDY